MIDEIRENGGCLWLLLWGTVLAVVGWLIVALFLMAAAEVVDAWL